LYTLVAKDFNLAGVRDEDRVELGFQRLATRGVWFAQTEAPAEWDTSLVRKRMQIGVEKDTDLLQSDRSAAMVANV